MSERDLENVMSGGKVPYVKPFYAINIKDKDEVLDWFKKTDQSLSDFFRPLFREQKNNLSSILGIDTNPNFSSPYLANFAAISDLYSDIPEVFINELYRVLVDQTSLVLSQDLVADVIPSSNEYNDKIASKVTKDWLDSMAYDLNLEDWRFKWQMQAKLFGESFAIVMWNPNKGDLHPLAKEKIDEDVDYLDAEGKTVSGEGGEPLKIKKNLRIGDVEFCNPFPWDVMEDPQLAPEDRLWFWWKEHKEVDYLKKKFPKFDWDSPEENQQYYDVLSGKMKDDPNRRTVYYFYHKSHEFLPEGRYIVCTREHMLVNRSLEMPTIIDNQTLPLVRFYDLQMGTNLRGIPITIRNCASLTDQYNILTNRMCSNAQIESPKFFVHENSGVDIQEMPDGSAGIEWMGNVKPTFETPTSNNSSIFQLREAIRKNIDEMAMQTPMVRGDVPNSQLDSFVALQHFEDLRNQLAGPEIRSHMRSMEQVMKLLITVAKDKYKKSDGRLIKIMGKFNSYELRYFDPINLQKRYDVVIRSTGNLANSKAAKTQMMITIKREFPNTVSDEFFVDSLGLSDDKKFMSAVTAAVNSAEAENQDMMSGNPVESPSRYEDLIVHWETHRIPMQTLDFKHAPENVKELFIGHVAATEKLMFEQAAENPVYQARLEGLKQFPIFYTPKPVNEQELPPNGGLPPDISPQDIPLEAGEAISPEDQLQQAVV